MSADPLFTIAAASGSLTEAAEQLVASLDVANDLGDRVLGVMIVQLARTIDAAGSRGRASAAAMAARELREAVNDIRERHQADAAGSPENEFASFREYMLHAVDESAS